MSKKHGDNLFSTFSSGIMMNRELLEYTIFTQTHTGPEGVSICRAGVGILTRNIKFVINVLPLAA